MVIFIAFSLFKGEVFAAEENYSETSEIIIEEADIPNLTIDPSKEVSVEKVIPPPAPTPEKNEEPVGDNRSWTRSEYKDLIYETSKKYNLDPQVIYATIMTESEGDPYAFRYEPDLQDASLCMGQILLSTARSLGFSGDPIEMYQPEVCIDLIGKYHRNMLDTYGELTPLQLATAYNSGSPWKRAVAGHLFRFWMWYNENS